MRIRHPRGRAVIFVLCAWFACAAGGAGCAHFPPWKRAAPTAPLANAPADTSAVLTPSPTVPVPVAPAGDKPVKRRQIEKIVVPAPSDSLPAPAELTPGDPSVDPVISVDLPPEEKARLRDTMQRELEQIRAVVESVDTGLLSPAGEETLRTIQALLKASRDATDRAEISEAAGLVHKAWILAAGISKR